MKILQINKYFYQRGGAETVFFNTIDLLKANGHDVIPFSIRHPQNRPSDYDSYFVDYPELSESGVLTKLTNIPNFIYNGKAAEQLEKLLIAEKPDIAHIHLLFNSFSVSILPILKKYNIPVVMTAHDYRLICPAYAITDGKGNICERCLKSGSYWHCITNKCSKGNMANSILLSLDSYFRKYFYSPINYIDHFIFVSHFSRNKHIESIPAFKEKSSKLYNFTLINDDNNPVKKKNDVLFFGRLSEEKGIQTLVEALKNTTISLKVVGDGPLRSQLEAISSPNIHFLGFKERDELKQYIKEARFVIVPSECYENNPMSIVESMTLGTPVIGSNIGGIPELISQTEEYRNGYLFEPKSASNLRNKIEEALSISDVRYEQLSKNAQNFAIDNFSVENHLNKLIEIYNFAIKNHK